MKKRLNAVFDEYIDIIRHLQSEQTIRTKIGYYKKHIKKPFGARYVDTLYYKELQIWANALLDSGLKPKTVKNIKDVLQVLCNYAIKVGYADKNPVYDIELPKFDNKRYFHYSLEFQRELIRAIAEFDEPIYSDIFLFLLHGRRLNEVLSLEWEFVDMQSRIYYIPAKINKAKRNMSYVMSEVLYNRLLAYYEDAKKRQKSLIPKGHIFINPKTGRKFVDVRKAWRRLLKRSNLPHTRIHDIRHLIGTYSINHLHIPIEQVSFTLGHTSIEVTQKYVTADPNIAKKVFDKIYRSVV